MSKPTNSQYRKHHYVPQWYQKRFLEANVRQKELFRLALKPEFITNKDGKRREVSPLRRRPIAQLFAVDDLYTLRFGEQVSTAIEQDFFGKIDDQGAQAVAWWGDFAHPTVERTVLQKLLAYMSSQKLRSPKGLDWLAQQIGDDDPNETLRAMVQFRTLFSTIWVESEWLIADAKKSETKFIVTDHPVTVYNRACGPRHEQCRGPNDPDVRLHGTHTIFPLSLDRVLILTNKSWAQNPYQSPTGWRPNPVFYRDSVFNFFEVQTNREVEELEVRQINFILKSRAYRTIAAAREEWLYPEEYVSKSDWAGFGQNYLLMPDPRGLHAGGEVMLGYEDGSGEAFDVFGRRPWEPDYAEYGSIAEQQRPLQKFQGEFARRFGPRRRSRSFSVGSLEGEVDSDEMHQYHLDLEPRRHRDRPRRSRRKRDVEQG